MQILVHANRFPPLFRTLTFTVCLRNVRELHILQNWCKICLELQGKKMGEGFTLHFLQEGHSTTQDMAKIKQDWVGSMFGFSGGWNQRGVQSILHKSLPSALINEIMDLKGQLYILQKRGQVFVNVCARQSLKIDSGELILLVTTYSSRVRA